MGGELATCKCAEDQKISVEVKDVTNAEILEMRRRISNPSDIKPAVVCNSDEQKTASGSETQSQQGLNHSGLNSPLRTNSNQYRGSNEFLVSPGMQSRCPQSPISLLGKSTMDEYIPCAKISLGDGDSYQGETLNGIFHGQGTLVLKSKGFEYSGTWADNKRHGEGTEIWNNGIRYKGEYANDLKDGYGELTLADGTHYTGYFAKNKFHGFGVLLKPGVCEYTGPFSNGQRHGKGKTIYCNGDIYEGGYFMGKRAGTGTFTTNSTQESYHGEWHDDKPHGIGYVTNQGGFKQKVLFELGKKKSELDD
jgi:hypothetical protein